MTEYAKGLEGVIANENSLSKVNGEEGKLCYAGYTIDDLVESCCYEEVVHLLHRGELPNAQQLKAFKEELASYRELPEQVIEFLKSAPRDASPMDVLRTAVSMIGMYDANMAIGEPDFSKLRHSALDLVSRVGVIVAYYHRARQGMDLPAVRKDLGEAAHFLYLINGKEPSEKEVKTLDVAYILHADHGMNASTFSARVTIATLSDIYSAITAAIGTLKGPLHGGANEGVIKMLNEIGSLDKVEAYVEEKLSKKQKIMGIGHRVYKVLDPRAPHLQRMAIELTEELGESKWIAMSEKIAEMMRERKGLNANVDFYSATVYYSLGIPTDLFTPIFAIARTSGWTAHVLEQLENNRLYRPRSIYVGPEYGRKLLPIDQRG